jgi:hypothetical protein
MLQSAHAAKHQHPALVGNSFSNNHICLLVALQGTDVDACYDAAFWNSFSGEFPASYGTGSLKQAYDIRFFRQVTRPQLQALRADMCGWRMVAKRGYMGALRGAVNATLQVGPSVHVAS